MKKGFSVFVTMAILLFTLSISAQAAPGYTDSHNLKIYEKLAELEGKYEVNLDLQEDISRISLEDLEAVEKQIREVNHALSEMQKQSVEFVNAKNRSSQSFSGTCSVDGTIPLLGLVRVYIPYGYSIITAGGAPYYSSAWASSSYTVGVSVGTFSCQQSWTEITPHNGGYRNQLEVNTKGTITYSAGPVNVTTPPQTFLKTFCLY